MKRFFVFAAMMLGLASCQNETNIFGVNVNTNEKAVEFTVNVVAPALDETRVAELGYLDSGKGAIENQVLASDNVTLRYLLDIYDAAGNRSKERYCEFDDGNTVTFKPVLIPGRKYTFVVWADIVKKDDQGEWVNTLYNVEDLTKVTINEANWKPMDETRDAYTGFTVEEVLPANGDIKVNLTRPFGKLRIITEDMKAVGDLYVSPDYAIVEYQSVPVYSFNALDGTYTPAANATLAKTHAMFEIVNYNSNVENKSMTLFTDYFFAPNEEVALGNFTLKVYDTNDQDANTQEYTTLITSTPFPTTIPVKRNTLTTIKGNLLTTNTGFTVTAEVNDVFTGGEVIYDENGNKLN